jgi:hypothetical protein
VSLGLDERCGGIMARRSLVFGLLCLGLLPFCSAADGDELHIASPMDPPEWALLQRELLRANAAACGEFFARYFDERGFLLCVERWGGDDGPDDAIENCNDWPLLYALGGDEQILRMVQRAWEGHLRQYTLAKTTEVPFARDGMYYKEFPVTFDWQHNGEGLAVFALLGLGTPGDPRLIQRTRRFAGFYMNEDPGAANYDPQHRVIRSLFNGSRGPLLRKATALDWTGDPIDVENRFELGHGERNYQEMLAHFEDYNDIVGDHPLNLLCTTLALNAYLHTHEDKYRKWLLDYVGAWRERMIENENIIPSNIGLDGRIGGECDGRWYGGVYGWSFTVRVPQTGELAHRNRASWGFFGFANAYLLTGDDRWLEPWRRQIAVINAQKKPAENGGFVYPRMYGDGGWYDFVPEPYRDNAKEIYFLSMRAADRDAVGPDEWLNYLEGKDADYPVRALRRDLQRVRARVAGMRADPTTPDTRLADDPMKFNPASVASLLELTCGGVHPGYRNMPVHCQLRYFDRQQRRAGLPADVAALVERISAHETTVTLVNVNQVEPRSLIVQSGAYAEHSILTATCQDRAAEVNGPHLLVRLDPGAGAQLRLTMKRHSRSPTFAAPALASPDAAVGQD